MQFLFAVILRIKNLFCLFFIYSLRFIIFILFVSFIFLIVSLFFILVLFIITVFLILVLVFVFVLRRRRALGCGGGRMKRGIGQRVDAAPVGRQHALVHAAAAVQQDYDLGATADPFDRLLIAQAQIEKVALLTADPAFALYDVEILRPKKTDKKFPQVA